METITSSTSKSRWSKNTVAVVTGANRGLGYEIVRLLAEQGLTVVLTARDSGKGVAAVNALKALGLQSVLFHQLEVSSPESVQKLANWLKREFGGFDILVNNAAILSNSFDYETAKLTIETNYYGTKNVTKGLLPLLRASHAGARIVNVTDRTGIRERLPGESLKKKLRIEEDYSDEFGDSLATKYLEDLKGGGADEKNWPWIPIHGIAPMYIESKIFLNIYAVALANSLSKSQPKDHQIFVVSFCPGLTETDLYRTCVDGGFVIPDGYFLKTAADGADTGVWLALLPKDELVEKNGKFYAERTEYAFGKAPRF